MQRAALVAMRTKNSASALLTKAGIEPALVMKTMRTKNSASALLTKAGIEPALVMKTINLT